MFNSIFHTLTSSISSFFSFLNNSIFKPKPKPFFSFLTNSIFATKPKSYADKLIFEPLNHVVRAIPSIDFTPLEETLKIPFKVVTSPISLTYNFITSSTKLTYNVTKTGFNLFNTAVDFTNMMMNFTSRASSFVAGASKYLTMKKIIIGGAIAYTGYKVYKQFQSRVFLKFDDYKLPRPHLPTINVNVQLLDDLARIAHVQNLNLPVPNFDQTPNVTNKNIADYFRYDYQTVDNPIKFITLQYYNSIQNLPNNLPVLTHQNLLYLNNNQVTIHSALIHRPTFQQATLELTPSILEFYKRFHCNMKRKVSRSERSYYFATYMMPRVILHLVQYDKFVKSDQSLIPMAQLILINFFHLNNITLPILNPSQIPTNSDYQDVYDALDSDQGGYKMPNGQVISFSIATAFPEFSLIMNKKPFEWYLFPIPPLELGAEDNISSLN